MDSWKQAVELLTGAKQLARNPGYRGEVITARLSETWVRLARSKVLHFKHYTIKSGFYRKAGYSHLLVQSLSCGRSLTNVEMNKDHFSCSYFYIAIIVVYTILCPYFFSLNIA